MSEKPRFENAPGNQVRSRKDGTWVCFWIARGDVVKEGYQPKLFRLWQGHEPTDAERAFISDSCQRFQHEMLGWRHRRDTKPQAIAFDGTLATLATCYQTDPDSGFHKKRYATRGYYFRLMRRLANDHGDVPISEIKGRLLLRWHEEWQKSGIAMAHSLIAMLRILSTFGSAILEDDACTLLSARLSKMEFQNPKPRVEQLTAEHVEAIRAQAHAVGRPEIALAQAIQFECMLRQRDIIGEWVPEPEPGMSDVLDDGRKWLRGIRWSSIDANLILRHVTSKRQKEVVHDLKLAPMVLAEFQAIYGTTDRAALPASGPVIVNGVTGIPFSAGGFRDPWRAIATAAGVPKHIRNQDSRAGAISEATDAGAELEHVRHAAAHSNISMTQRYSRGAEEKTAQVMQIRAAFRKGKTGENEP